MSNIRMNLRIVRLMLTEERRLNGAIIGQWQFLLFPVMILFMAFVIALSSKNLLRAMPMNEVYIILHSIMLIYGLGVGGFALFGNRIAEKRFGDVTSILETPKILPIDFRSVFLDFYIKDTIYYMLYSIIPLVAGIGLTIPFTGFRTTSVLFLLLTIALSFLIGISFSFFLSSMYVRWKAVFAAAVLAILMVFAVGYFTRLYDATQLIPSIALQRTGDPVYVLISAVLILAFSYIAVKTVKVRFGKASEKYSEEMLPVARKFTFAKSYSTLMAKDWIDLIRSGTLFPVVGAYLGPLAFLALLFWLLGSVLMLPLHFNMIFFGAMIGFFGVSVYGWLNMLDTAAFLEVLPVSVSKVIRMKLLLFTMLASVTSTVFLVILSALQGEMDLLWIGLIVAYSTTFFTVTSTAYLTGLRTNSYLFDPGILAKFAALVVPPLIAMAILSFNYASNAPISAFVILSVSGILVLATFLLYRGIDRRWSGESFVF